MPDVPGSCHRYETPQLRHLTWLTNIRTHRRERKMDFHVPRVLPSHVTSASTSQTNPQMETDIGTSGPATLSLSIYKSGGIPHRPSILRLCRQAVMSVCIMASQCVLTSRPTCVHQVPADMAQSLHLSETGLRSIAPCALASAKSKDSRQLALELANKTILEVRSAEQRVRFKGDGQCSCSAFEQHWASEHSP